MGDLDAIADSIRQDVLRVAIEHEQAHIAPSLSTIEILVALWYDVMEKEDIFVLSKGHGCYGYYAILADKGLMPLHVWENFELEGCATRHPEWGIPCSTGSLGHGYPIAVGMAFAKRLRGEKGHVWCLCGDGELEEGSMWEAMGFALHRSLPLSLVIDANGLQALDRVDAIWKTPCIVGDHVVMGHAIEELSREFRRRLPIYRAITVKGRGVPYMEGVAKWHFRVP